MIDEKRIFELKRKYDEIPVPEGLKTRVENAVRQARENPKHRISRLWHCVMNSGIAVAAAMLVIFLLANVSPSTANAMRNIPVIGSIAEFLTIHTYSDARNGVEVSVEIPEISGMADENAQNNLNDAVTDYVDTIIAQYNSDADTAGAYFAEYPELLEESHTAHESIQTFCRVLTENEQIFSLEMITDITMAGAQEIYKHFNVDKMTGKVLTLSDLFLPSSDYLPLIQTSILSQMQEQMAADDRLVYFPEDLAQALSAEQDFYVTQEGKLVISFNEYDVAPGCMGAVSFTIPTEDIAPVLNANLVK